MANWLLVGIVFQVFDVTIQGFDIIPDVLGAVFVAVGAFILTGSSPGDRAERAAGLVQVLAAGLWPFVHRVVLLLNLRRVGVIPLRAEPGLEMPQG